MVRLWDILDIPLVDSIIAVYHCRIMSLSIAIEVFYYLYEYCIQPKVGKNKKLSLLFSNR